MLITVVIPTYNEAENLPKLISTLFSLPLDLHLLVVDDNSPDGTGHNADELAAYPGRVDVLHRAGRMGLSSAYLKGFQKVLDGGAQAIVQMDADFSHDPSVLVYCTRRQYLDKLDNQLRFCSMVIRRDCVASLPQYMEVAPAASVERFHSTEQAALAPRIAPQKTAIYDRAWYSF